MANSFYTAFLNGILGAHATRVDLDTDTIKMFLRDVFQHLKRHVRTIHRAG